MQPLTTVQLINKQASMLTQSREKGWMGIRVREAGCCEGDLQVMHMCLPTVNPSEAQFGEHGIPSAGASQTPAAAGEAHRVERRSLGPNCLARARSCFS